LFVPVADTPVRSGGGSGHLGPRTGRRAQPSSPSARRALGTG